MKVISILLLFVLLSISCNSQLKARNKKGTIEFENSEVKGVVTKFFTSMGGSKFKVDNDFREYLFTYDRSSNPVSLSHWVEIGDSLIKEKESMLFEIKKRNGKSQVYTLKYP